MLVEVEVDAYPDEAKAASRRFERDIERLRDWGVEIVTGPGHEYHLQSYGVLSPVSLDDAELSTLAFERDLRRDAAGRSRAAPCWRWTGFRSGSAARSASSVSGCRSAAPDDDFISSPVQAAVEKAHDERRQLRFWYLSPGQADGKPRQHTVEPWHLHFDTMRRHLYLDAYRLRVSFNRWESGASRAEVPPGAHPARRH